MKKNFYVIGNNTKKSLSPIIFNYWFKSYKINASYNYLEIDNKDFEKKIKELLHDKSVGGFNITIPFKEKIIPHLLTIDSHSRFIGAVNCATRVGEGFEGANTDWIGFGDSLNWFRKNNKNNLKKKQSAIIVGYGGSAKAILYALRLMEYKSIKIFNRSFEKIKNIKNVKALELKDLAIHAKKADIVINTIPKDGFYLDDLKKLGEYGNYKNKNIGYDLAYNTQTGFLDLFSKTKRIKGIYMLVFQAAPCFEEWFGIRPKIDQGLLELIEKKSKTLT
jgi:shikimate dehydrogenase